MVVLVPFILVVRAGLAAGDVGLNVRDDKFMANISKSGNESDAFSSVAGRLDMLDNIGNELVEDERVAGAAELAHDQLREHIQAVSGVDASLVDQARERQGSGDLKLLVLLNEFGLDEILKKDGGASILLKHVLKVLVPFYRPRLWRPKAHRLLWLFRPYKSSLVVLQKPSLPIAK